MIKDPRTKIISKLVVGHPLEARMSDHKVGKSKSNVPVWLDSLIRLAKAWWRGPKTDSEESEGCEVGINE